MTSTTAVATSTDAIESTSVELQTIPATTIALETEALPSIPEDEEGDTTIYPQGTKFFLVFISLTMLLLLAGLDVSILSTALPAITDEFNTIADVGWYSTAYRLSSSSLQFACGKLYKEYATKRLLLLSFGIFLTGSVLSAAAVTSKMFVVGRAVTGVAVAGGTAGFFTILTELVPLRQRPLYGSIFAFVEGVSALAAPALGNSRTRASKDVALLMDSPGGIITQSLGWRW